MGNKGIASATVSDLKGNEMSSGVLERKDFHKYYMLWMAKTMPNSVVPNYVTDSITALFAFSMLGQKQKAEKKAELHADGYMGDDYAPKPGAARLAAEDDILMFASPSEPAMQALDTVEVSDEDPVQLEENV